MKLSDEIKQAELPDAHTEAVLNLHFTSHWLYWVYHEELKRFDISNEQYNILRILRGNRARTSGTYNLCDVQERMLNRTANATRLVEKLRKRGLVSRQPNEEDRRRVDIEITGEGLSLLAKMDEPLDAMNRRTAQALTSEEAGTLTQLLERLRERLDVTRLT